MYRDTTRGETENGNVFWIASKLGDVLLNPFKSGDLIHEGVTAFGFIRMLLAEGRESKMA